MFLIYKRIRLVSTQVDKSLVYDLIDQNRLWMNDEFKFNTILVRKLFEGLLSTIKSDLVKLYFIKSFEIYNKTLLKKSINQPRDKLNQ